MLNQNKIFFAGLMLTTAGSILLLIVLGALVRLTEAELACGSEWLLCNGQLFPSLHNDLGWIDWGHRLATLLVSAFMLGTFLTARHHWVMDTDIMNPIYLAVGLLVIQTFLGAATTWQWLPTLPLLHLGFAVMMLSCLIAALTALLYSPKSYFSKQDTFPTAVHAATLMTFMVLMTGAMVVGDNAAQACTGFPLCANPLDDSVAINLIHRGSVLLLGIVLLTLVWRARTERPSDRGTSIGAFTLMGLFIAQALIGGVYVQYGYETLWSALHVLFAGLTWAAAVALSIAVVKQQQVEFEVEIRQYDQKHPA
jgi:heme a synthase